MKTIYEKDKDGKLIAAEVSDELAAEHRNCLRGEWRSDSKARYHNCSIDKMIAKGCDFKDERTDVEAIIEIQEEKKERALQLKKLKAALPCLTKLQRQTIYKLYYLNISQSQIAREECVSEQAVSDRVKRILTRLKKIMNKDLVIRQKE